MAPWLLERQIELFLIFKDKRGSGESTESRVLTCMRKTWVLSLASCMVCRACQKWPLSAKRGASPKHCQVWHKEQKETNRKTNRQIQFPSMYPTVSLFPQSFEAHKFFSFVKTPKTQPFWVRWLAMETHWTYNDSIRTQPLFQTCSPTI